jgi:hypothetical protein
MNEMTVVNQVAGFLPILTVLGVVSFVFLSALGIVWALKQIGGRLTADFRGTVKRFGASLVVTGTGLVGSTWQLSLSSSRQST